MQNPTFYLYKQHSVHQVTLNTIFGTIYYIEVPSIMQASVYFQ